MAKGLLFALLTALCGGLMFAPELVMWGIWHLVGPESFWEKFAMIFLFGSFGLGLSIFTFWLGLVAWAHGADALLKGF